MTDKIQQIINVRIARNLLKQISDMWGGDEPEFLKQVIDEIIEKNKNRLEKMIEELKPLLNKNLIPNR